MLMFSTEGGMDIESVDESLLFRLNIDPQYGLQSYDAIDVCTQAGIAPADLSKFASFLTKLSKLYKKYDCQTLEINPFVMTGDGSLYCADCKMEIDNSAVFRHPDFGIKIARDLPGQPTDLDVIGWGIEETDARGTGFLMNMGYDEVSPGYVGYHPIGGGSAMMGLDALNAVGLKAANYADTSGNPVAAKIYRVAKATLSQPNIEGYLLGGFMMANQEQWHHAHALVKVLREMLPKKPGFPCVLLLCGNREDESLEILRTGLADMMTPDGIGRRIEIYGREHVTDTKFIGERLLALCKEYSAEKTSEGRVILEIKEKSSTVSIDVSKCLSCETKACVAACKKYARGILELKDGVPSVEHLTAEEVLRLGTECLACEFACTFHGNKAITIDVPVAGLPEYLAKRGLA